MGVSVSASSRARPIARSPSTAGWSCITSRAARRACTIVALSLFGGARFGIESLCLSCTFDASATASSGV